MTKEELLEALAILIGSNATVDGVKGVGSLGNLDVVANMIYELYMVHPDYKPVDGKIVHRQTGKEFKL